MYTRDDAMDDFNHDIENPALNDDSEEDLPLLPEEFEIEEASPRATPSGWFGALRGAIKTIGTGIKNTVTTGVSAVIGAAKYVVARPISSTLAFLAATPNGLNALVAPSGINPAELGSEWWNNMSGFRRVYSLASATSSVTINTVMNASFIPQAGQRLKNSLQDMRQGLSKATLNIVSIFLGLGAGIAQGSISYSAYLWLPLGTFTASPFALLSFIVTFSSRFLSIKNIFHRIGHLLNANARLQQAYADKINHIAPQHRNKAAAKLKKLTTRYYEDRELDEPLSEEDLQELICAFSEKLHKLQLAHPDFIQATSNKEYVAKYAGLLTDITLTLLLSTSGFMTFTQKGFDGINTLAKFTGRPLDDLGAGWKALIGLNPGIASFMFYGNHCFDLRNTLTSLVKHLYQNPRNIPSALMLLLTNGLGSNSMNSVGTGIIKRPDNLFGLAQNAVGSTYVVLITVAAAAGNANAAMSKFSSSPTPAPIDIQLSDISQYLNNPGNHLISDETASVLRRNNLFTSPNPQPPSNTSVQDDHTPQNWNPFDTVNEF